MVGWEGIFGVMLTLMMLIPAQFFMCPYESAECDATLGHHNDIFMAFRQACASPDIALYTMGFFIASSMGNGFSTYVTKVTSATNSIVFDQSRIIFVWVFFLTYGGVGHESFSLEKLFGFTMICLGVLVFNQIIDLE